MIIDTFTFFNELDLLNVRFKELYDVVDAFVIAESTHTFSGKPKKLVFYENMQRFVPYLDKVHHVIVNDMPLDTDNAWVRETHQRNALITCLKEHFPLDATVMLSDVDEIPYRDIVRQIQPNQSCRMQFFYYDLWSELDYLWHGTTTTYLGDIDTMQHLRDQRYNLPAFPSNDWHGCHLSYWGGALRIREKIQSMSDTQLNIPEYTDVDRIHARMVAGKDLFDRDIRIIKHIESPLPERMQRWLLDSI